MLTIHQQKYEVLKDPYSNTQRLNLYAFDGAPLNPMHLAYKPPQMLPTQTLNPTTVSATGGAKPTGSAKTKRYLKGDESFLIPSQITERKGLINPELLWWIGAGMTALGGVGYFCF